MTQGLKKLFKACACENDAGIHIFDEGMCDFKKPWDNYRQEEMAAPETYFKADEEHLVLGGPELTCDHEDAGDGNCVNCGTEI